MRHILVYCAIGLLICLSAATLYGDIARPKPSSGDRKIVFHTSLSVVPDTNASEARLRITPATLNNIRAAMAGAQASETMGQRIAHSSPRTIIAGFFLFLSASFAGIWLTRAGQGRGQKVVAALLLGIAVAGATTLITRGNAGPPPSERWQNLSKVLSDGRAMSGGLDIEISGEGNGVVLTVPAKK